jgi:hypothetical protein
MPTSAAPDARATVSIFTFKEGLLARMAHDLRIDVGDFRIELARGHVRARFAAGSLRVEGAMRDGRLEPWILGAGDRDKIRATMESEILQVRRYPEIEFDGAVEGAGPPWAVAGELRLVGRARPLRLQLSVAGEEVVGRVRLTASEYGIQPYRALGGALRLQDRVEVAVRLAAAGRTDPSFAWHDANATWSAGFKSAD